MLRFSTYVGPVAGGKRGLAPSHAALTLLNTLFREVPVPFFHILLVVATTIVLPRATLAEPPVRDHTIGLEDYFTLGVVGDVVMSPDSKHAAYTETRWAPPAEKRNTDLWVVDCKTHVVNRLTFDPASDSSPRWSPNGKWIYFRSARKRAGEKSPPLNGKAQVWRVPADGSSGPTAVTRVERGVQQFELSWDGGGLYYTTISKHVDTAWKTLRNRYDELDYGHGVVNHSQVWRLDLQSWRADKLVDDRRVIMSFAVSPSEKRIAMITTPTEALISFEGWSRVDVWDADSRQITSLPDKMWRTDAPSPHGWIDPPLAA